jgi:Uma2 family endonuclease
MTALAQKPMTAEEFAVWAGARPEKHWELFDGVAQMQQLQTWGHQEAVMALYRLFYAAIREANLPLFVGTQGVAVKTGAHMAFEPDVVIFSGRMAKAEMIVPEPVIVAEVLSPSTARKDLTVKLAGYFDVPSIEHYLIADWEEREIIHYRREGGALAKPVILREGLLMLKPPGLTLDVSKVFQES